MYLSPFFRVIAIIFFVLFALKFFNPKHFPFIRKGVDKIFSFFGYTLKLLIESSIYTFTLLFTRTVYVIGLDIIIALLFNGILTAWFYPISDFSNWFNIYINNIIDVYIVTFFVATYVIGLFTFINVKHNIKTNIFNFFENQFKFKFIHTKKGNYTYDEDNNKYTYYN